MKGEYPGTDSAPLQLIYCIKKTTGSTDGSIKRLLRKLRINRAISYSDQAGKKLLQEEKPKERFKLLQNRQKHERRRNRYGKKKYI